MSALTIGGIVQNGALTGLLRPGYEEWMFLLEFGIGVVLPFALLLRPRIRASERWLVVTALLVVLGFVVNRLNVSVTGMERSSGVRYIPSWMELTVSLGLVGIGFALFALAVRFLPIFPEAKSAEEPEPEEPQSYPVPV